MTDRLVQLCDLAHRAIRQTINTPAGLAPDSAWEALRLIRDIREERGEIR